MMLWFRHLPMLFAFLIAFVRLALASASTPGSPVARIGTFQVATQLFTGETGATSRDAHQHLEQIVVTHQMFVGGGTINGAPIVP
jgi:hypothetical protein